MRLLFLALILIFGPEPSYAQTANPEKLESLTKAEEDARKKEAELAKKRDAIASEVSKLKKDLVRNASEAEKFEREGLSLETKLSDLDREATSLNDAIYGDRKTLMRLLAALQRIENKLDANEKTLAKRRAKISKLVGQKSELEKSVAKDREDARREVTKLAAEAKSLRELIESFEAATADVGPRVKPGSKRKKRRTSIAAKPVKLPKGVTKFASAKGKLRAPVPGRITRNYGSGEKGMTVSTRSKAQVISPYAGRIVNAF